MTPETIEQFLSRKHTKQTAIAYGIVIDNFISANPRAANYQYKDLVNHFAELKKRYPNTGTRIKMLSVVKRYYDYLIETKQRNDHPCKHLTIKGDNIGKRKQVQFQDLFTPTELEKLLDRENRYGNLELLNKIIISLLIYQGLTSDEIVRLDVQNIDFDNSTVYVKASPKINNRLLKLHRLQLEWLENYLKTDRKELLKVKSNRLLINKEGNPESVENIARMLRPLKHLYPERQLNAQNIRLSVIANWLNIYKHRLEEVQEWAGHKWPSATLRYKRIDINERREKINRWHPLK